MNKVGARIRKIREQRGLSQENVATELGITQLPMLDWKKRTIE